MKHHAEMLYTRAIEGHPGAEIQPNFFSKKIIEKGCAKDLYHIGLAKNETAITQGRFEPGGFECKFNASPRRDLLRGAGGRAAGGQVLPNLNDCAASPRFPKEYIKNVIHIRDKAEGYARIRAVAHDRKLSARCDNKSPPAHALCQLTPNWESLDLLKNETSSGLPQALHCEWSEREFPPCRAFPWLRQGRDLGARRGCVTRTRRGFGSKAILVVPPCGAWNSSSLRQGLILGVRRGLIPWRRGVAS